ncbi:PREDICTED: uncharacterized protein LOC108968857 [Bactrocera latifrons]|uniref:Uncharacterized protein n=1 Tax=Bactrocera latifrons TaxID=174628 RepID=A0A0K8WF49_BACLA|nr:PREDICTED: uncharacterized protein LOC108968857 [Bactrocera latifrons]
MLTQFCCLRLETTAKIIGWLGSFVTIVVIIICAELLRNARALLGTLTRRGYHFDDPEDAGTVLIIILAVSIVVLFINAFANGCLVYGTVKKYHKLILPWLIITAIGTVLSLVALIIYGFYSAIFGVAFIAYLWIAMYSLYSKIKTANEQRSFKRGTRSIARQIA